MLAPIHYATNRDAHLSSAVWSSLAPTFKNTSSSVVHDTCAARGNPIHAESSPFTYLYLIFQPLRVCSGMAISVSGTSALQYIKGYEEH